MSHYESVTHGLITVLKIAQAWRNMFTFKNVVVFSHVFYYLTERMEILYLTASIVLGFTLSNETSLLRMKNKSFACSFCPVK